MGSLGTRPSNSKNQGGDSCPEAHCPDVQVRRHYGNGICGPALAPNDGGIPIPCPRTNITRAKQPRRCSEWQRPPPIRLLRPGLLKPPPKSETKLASYPLQ